MGHVTEPLSTHALAGRTIVVTRPEQQAQALCDLIRGAGGSPVLFPAIEIVDVPDLQPVLAMITRLSSFDLAVFVSPNAVSKAMSLIAARGGLPPKLRVATIGKGSVRALHRFGVEQVIAPEGAFDSEALLALPDLQEIAGRRVVIFRGEGGRELLGDTLSARGAMVEYAQCYRRSRPRADSAPLLALWARDALSGVVVTSSEGLRNLADMVGEKGRQRLARTPLFVPHARIAETARALGMTRVVLIAPGDEAIVRGMIDWWGDRSALGTDG